MRKSTSLSETIAHKSGSNFLCSFLFLPKEQRHAIRTVYAFARRLDDSVDELEDPAQQRSQIADWKEELGRCYQGQPSDPAMQELARTIRRFSIPREPFEELIRGCEMDIEQDRYETFDDLRQYCYRVASAVGLMCLPIFGCRSADAEQYAIHLGLALQLTNILRDVGADARRTLKPIARKASTKKPPGCCPGRTGAVSSPPGSWGASTMPCSRNSSNRIIPFLARRSPWASCKNFAWLS